MNKKSILIIFMLLLSTFALGYTAKEPIVIKDKSVIDQEEKTKSNIVKPTIDIPPGLTVAYEKVTNEQAKIKILENMAKFQEKHKYQYDDYNVQESNDDSTKVKAKKKIKIFGFIPYTFTDELEIDNEGNVVQQKRAFLAQFFSSRITYIPPTK